MKKLLVFVVSLLMMLLLTVNCVCFAALRCVQRAVRVETVDAIVNSEGFGETITALLAGQTVEFSDVEIDMSLVMADVLESGELQAYLSDYARAVLDGMLYDKQTAISVPQSLVDQLVESISEQIVAIYDEKYQVGIESIDELKRELLRVAAEEQVGTALPEELQQILPQPADFIASSPELTTLMRDLAVLISPTGIICVIVSGLVFVGILFLANRKKLARACCLTGVSLLGGGALVVLMGIVLGMFDMLLAAAMEETFSPVLLQTICEAIFGSLIPLGVIYIGIAVLLFVLAVVLAVKRRKAEQPAA